MLGQDNEKKETKGRADNIDRLVSKRLKVRRMMLGLSQQDLGNAVDVSIQQIQKYEKASNRISSGKLFTLSKFLKVPISYFFEQGDDTSNTIGNIFAEDTENYIAGDKEPVSEKELIVLINAFSEIKSTQSRKKITELVKTMH
jgi:transcriptional regulator with XRE-family HTH domain